MLAPLIPLRPVIRQTCGDTPLALSEILEDGVNLALWQRQLPLHIAEFGALLVALDEPLAESLVIELASDDAVPNVQGLAACCRDLEGYEGFIADVSWLIGAFACLLGARRIGVRLRLLDKAMCPRFHVDHVPALSRRPCARAPDHHVCRHRQPMVARRCDGPPPVGPGECRAQRAYRADSLRRSGVAQRDEVAWQRSSRPDSPLAAA